MQWWIFVFGYMKWKSILFSVPISTLIFMAIGKVLNGRLERKVLLLVMCSNTHTHMCLLGRNTGVGFHFLLQGSSHLRDQTCVSCIPCIGRQIFTTVPAAWEAPVCSICFLTKSVNMPEPKLFYVVISSLSCFPFEIVKAKIFVVVVF